MNGISIYFGLDNSRDENIELLNMAKRLGYKRIFTSFHIPEVNYDVLKKEGKEFLDIAKSYGMDVISDISPDTFKFLGIEDMDLKSLSELGVKTIRIDYGYTEEEITIMSKNNYNIKLQFNASTVTEEFFNKLDKYNPNYNNIDALHNFYPRVGTGLGIESFQEKNKILKKRNIKICAFVQSNYKKRGPLKDGLPTLEDHRNEEVRIAANYLYALGISDIFIGDSMPNYEEMKDLSELKKDIVELRIKELTKDQFTKNFLKNHFTCRIDGARDAIRANESRIILGGHIIEGENNYKRNVGSVTLDNKGYGRYMGELQILKRCYEADERVNVVAEVIKEDLKLLKYIKNNRGFRFAVVE